ncbi:ABC transporter permease [Faecalicatena contorta]|uniref:Fluoroquinolone transport system permease protein n=1 Tax=Faecalicatena contorta TaxID=39482 RepID=A0A315ZWP0_9FIRM|nr:ABC transporter permease [Faecalicatena contorta]PWJ50056.1 fluoroquinolone transport system permease protein [Faecalicatena contorta]SUQ14177.1 fluoroquinolone transport system permease protein [Faecalicatena contorta]
MRIVKLILGDIHFQFKYGFYFIYLLFCALYVFLLFIFPETWREKAVSIMIYSDPAAMGLFFMGAIVLLEKSQRVLNALAVSPVKAIEYIIAKTISLMLISVLVSFVLAFVAGIRNIPEVLLATALTSIIFTLLGLIAATKINSLNQYIIMTAPLELICFVPPIIYLFVPSAIIQWYPLNGSMALISNSSQNPLRDISMLLIVIVCLFMVAQRATMKMWRSLGGVKL